MNLFSPSLLIFVLVTMMMCKQKKSQRSKGNRLLISITVLGSSGPIRFVVNEDDLVAAVIDMVLKAYARQRRLPVLGSDINNFVLCCPTAGAEALSPWETIGSLGLRNFMLCKKPQPENGIEEEKASKGGGGGGGGGGSWKALFNKSLNLKVSTN